jgi:hypothetical protein
MTTLLVTSSDGIIFRVETTPRAAVFERMYAARETAAQLEQHGDFVRVRSMDDLVAPEISVTFDEITPLRPRPQLRLIPGGKL